MKMTTQGPTREQLRDRIAELLTENCHFKNELLLAKMKVYYAHRLLSEFTSEGSIAKKFTTAVLGQDEAPHSFCSLLDDNMPF